MADKTLETLNHCFEFLESAFGESQEMAVFVTELNSNVYSIAFLRENDCAMYYKYNKGLLWMNAVKKSWNRWMPWKM